MSRDAVPGIGLGLLQNRGGECHPVQASRHTGSSRNSTWRPAASSLPTASLTPRWGAGTRGPGRTQLCLCPLPPAAPV